jgi:hypothetical protein
MGVVEDARAGGQRRVPGGELRRLGAVRPAAIDRPGKRVGWYARPSAEYHLGGPPGMG